MKISKITEPGARPPLALASATVWLPAGFRKAASVAWVVDADAALRALFPNIPEEIEGPWGKLSRSDVLGAEDLASALLDAMETIVIDKGRLLSPGAEDWGFSFGTESFADRVESGKAALGEGVLISDFSCLSTAPSVEIHAPTGFLDGDRRAAKRRVDELLREIDQTMREWIPALARLADHSRVEVDDLAACSALAERARLAPSSEPAAVRGPKRSL